MGRTKGQLEKVKEKYRGLKRADLALLIKYGESAVTNKLDGIKRLEAWIEDSEKPDLETRCNLLESISQYFEGIHHELNRRIDEAEFLIKELNDERGSIEATAKEERREVQSRLKLAQANEQDDLKVNLEEDSAEAERTTRAQIREMIDELEVAEASLGGLLRLDDYLRQCVKKSDEENTLKSGHGTDDSFPQTPSTGDVPEPPAYSQGAGSQLEQAPEAEGSYLDPRYPAFKAYVELESQLGRAPLRGEFESHWELQNQPIASNSATKAVQRIALPLGDTRIHNQLKKVLEEAQDKGPEKLSVSQRIEILRDQFENLKVGKSKNRKSPEADRLRTPLGRTPILRILEILSSGSINCLIDQSVQVGTLVDHEFKPLEIGEESKCEGRSCRRSDPSATYSNFGGIKAVRIPPPAKRIEFVRAVNRSPALFSLIQAFRSLSRLWGLSHRWEFDRWWLRPDHPADYGVALDCLLLSLSQTDDNCRDVGTWLKAIADRDLEELLCSIWAHPNHMSELTPMSFRPVREGIEIIMVAVRKLDSTAECNCAELAKYDPQIADLISFLDPFDVLLKGEEYGFGP
ncbi:MAG: hypothetical protein ACI8UO_002635 [Verrucomicrobiales bacterium]|jgi:hypothetical protein